MNVLLDERNVYEDFDMENNVLYFKIGVQGLVSFHGRNYNRKKRMTAEEIQTLTTNAAFYPINSHCYINLAKIKSVSGGTVYFGSENSFDSKHLPVNRRKQALIEQKFLQLTKRSG